LRTDGSRSCTESCSWSRRTWLASRRSELDTASTMFRTLSRPSRMGTGHCRRAARTDTRCHTGRPHRCTRPDTAACRSDKILRTRCRRRWRCRRPAPGTPCTTCRTCECRCWRRIHPGTCACRMDTAAPPPRRSGPWCRPSCRVRSHGRGPPPYRRAGLRCPRRRPCQRRAETGAASRTPPPLRWQGGTE
jgi:hypothetical protein